MSSDNSDTSNYINIIICTHQNALACLFSLYGLGGSDEGMIRNGIQSVSAKSDILTLLKTSKEPNKQWDKLSNGSIVKLVIDDIHKKVTVQLAFAGLFKKEKKPMFGGPPKITQPYPSEEIVLTENDDNYESYNRLVLKICPDLLGSLKIVTFYLVRHGEGGHNTAPKGYSPPDATLTEVGKLEGMAAGLWINEDLVGLINLVGISDLVRTAQTGYYATSVIPFTKFAGGTKQQYVLPSDFEINDVQGKPESKCNSLGIVGANTTGITFRTKENKPTYFFDLPECQRDITPSKYEANNQWKFDNYDLLLRNIVGKLNERIGDFEYQINKLNNVNAGDDAAYYASNLDILSGIVLQHVKQGNDNVAQKVQNISQTIEGRLIEPPTANPPPTIDWNMYTRFWADAWHNILLRGRKSITSNKCLMNRSAFRSYNSGKIQNMVSTTNMLKDAVSAMNKTWYHDPPWDITWNLTPAQFSIMNQDRAVAAAAGGGGKMHRKKRTIKKKHRKTKHRKTKHRKHKQHKTKQRKHKQRKTKRDKKK